MERQNIKKKRDSVYLLTNKSNIFHLNRLQIK